MLLTIAIFVMVLTVSYKCFYRYADQRTSMNARNFSDSNLSNIHKLFLKTVFTLLGYVAKCDGAVNAQEIELTENFMTKMDLDSNHKREAIRLFKMGAEPKFNVQNTINNFKSLSQKSPSLTQTLLGYLINLARADGLLVNKEVDAMQKVALGLGYSTATFNDLLKMGARKNSEENTVNHKESNNRPQQNRTYIHRTENRSLAAAYKIIEVRQSASNTEITKAYRKLANQYHPDKLIGKSLQTNRIIASAENFKSIQAAYDEIKKSRT
jgi:DnaJ like chaperone protein